MHLILHVGLPKTGSTAIQGGLMRHGEAMLAQGIHVFMRPPINGRGLSVRYETRRRQKLAPRLIRDYDLRSIEDAQAWSEQNYWQPMEEELARRKPACMVLSSENFARLGSNREFMDRLRGLADQITVLAYVRDPVAQFTSAMDQNIRWFNSYRKALSLENDTLELAGCLRDYEAALGSEHLVIRNFDRSNLAGGDAVTDFLAQVSALSGIALDLPVEPGQLNEGLSGAAVAFLLLLNNATVQGPEHSDRKAATEHRYKLLDRLRASPEIRALPRLRIEDPDLQNHIRRQSADTLAWLNGTYLTDQIPLPMPEPRAPELSATERRERMVRLLLEHLTPAAMEAITRELLMEPI